MNPSILGCGLDGPCKLGMWAVVICQPCNITCNACRTPFGSDPMRSESTSDS